ncbi:hypothetical protein SDC9_16648 [bioreactor metagenome]|uniref:Uncharacterized protein n=1 Tax=bioreactor metagenome TaxID=1076179 RepID=A0A644TV72_9ZZZZ
MGGEGYEDGDHGGDEPGVARTEYEHDAHHDAKRRAGEEASCLSSVYGPEYHHETAVGETTRYSIRKKQLYRSAGHKEGGDEYPRGAFP